MNEITCDPNDTFIFDGNIPSESNGVICFKPRADDLLSNYSDGWGVDRVDWGWSARTIWPGLYNGFFDCAANEAPNTFIARHYYFAFEAPTHMPCGDSPTFGATTWVRSTLNSCTPSSCPF